MKQNRSHPYLRAILLFIFAGCLIGIGGIGVSRAIPAIRSEYYYGGVELYDIGVDLLENGRPVADGEALLGNLVPEGEEFHMGETYSEMLSVHNSGTIDEYVRVTIYKYWLDENGEKITSLSPDLIDLHLLTGYGWVEDTSASAISSPERTVLYYTSVLPVGGSTPAFSDTLTVSGDIPYKVTQSTENNVITTTYDYEDKTFQVDVQVDGVQTHSAADAIRSAWGRSVTVSDGQLSLLG